METPYHAMTGSEQPLIRAEESDDEPECPFEAEDDDADYLVVADDTPTAYVWMLTAVAGLSGLLFGCKSPIPPHENIHFLTII